VSIAASDSAPEALARHPFVWGGEVKVLEASLEEITLEISWSRLIDGRGAVSENPPGVTAQLVTLRIGERVALDMVQMPDLAEEACLRNLVLELAPSFPIEAALAARDIDYEIWMVHDTPWGAATYEAWRSTSVQGEEVRFRFDAKVIQAPGGEGDGGPPALCVDIDGSVRGWLRSDGSVDLVFEATRSLHLAETSTRSAEAGRKVVRVQPGKAVRLVLPPVNPAADDQAAVELTGHSFSLVLVATPHSD
jgi:hypothetical protein